MAPISSGRVLGHGSARLLSFSAQFILSNLFHLRLRPRVLDPTLETHVFTKRASEFDPHQPKFIVFAVLIPVLVLLSGLFAGLTLGYMSLDETQLNVLSISGNPKQREYARKIQPIRKNGHLLLVTLLLSNMIVNESLPVIADPVIGGGVQSVVVSTVLIVIFAEIIPQSLFSRYGLYLGAKMAGVTKVLIYVMGIVAWPVAKVLEFALGPHHGIMYRRAELKELIAMHSTSSPLGGDLKVDTVNIIGATLDLQEKDVHHAMTPISDVFMLSIDEKLDYDTVRRICDTGHSRIPVYEEIEAPASFQIVEDGEDNHKDGMANEPTKVKRIVGILLVKRLVLLDTKVATPLRNIQLNKVFFVPKNHSLLGILDKFQEGHSHIAIVSRFSAKKANSVKKAVKRGLTKRLKDRVGLWDNSDSESEKGDMKTSDNIVEAEEDVEAMTIELKNGVESGRRYQNIMTKDRVGEELRAENDENGARNPAEFDHMKAKKSAFQNEQNIPSDAVLTEEGAEEFLQGLDPAIMPVGIITLEDVLEQVIGEEIYDEFDIESGNGSAYVQSGPAIPPISVVDSPPKGIIARRSFGFTRSTSTAQVINPKKRKDAKNDTPGSLSDMKKHVTEHRQGGISASPSTNAVNQFGPLPIAQNFESGGQSKSLPIAEPEHKGLVSENTSEGGAPFMRPLAAEVVLARHRGRVGSSSVERGRPQRTKTKGSFKSSPIEKEETKKMLDSESIDVRRASPAPLLEDAVAGEHGKQQQFPLSTL